MSKPKILVCVLTGTERQNWINPELSMMLWRMSRDPRFDVEIANIRDAFPVEVARNHTIKLARDCGFTWACSLDNDNFMPVGTPLDVIAAAGPQQSIIGLTYGVPASSSAYQLFPPNAKLSPLNDGLFQEVSAVGGGVLMVNRRVWETIPSGPWFRWLNGADKETLSQSSGGCGEDVYFCRLAQQHGLRVWTHRELLAGHYRTTDITGLVCTMAQMMSAAGSRS